ncbi:MAG TPA: translesion DNA synthesis-associated protein ImuA [Burkholderiales bacterium]|nr:translesion DNA synthesis-associated protein ImuA [Burkholderiales bacterium]
MALEEVLRHPRVWRGNALAGGVPAVPTGFAELDAELPGGGWPAGGLTELLVSAKGIGELGLVTPALAKLTCAGKRVVWLAPPYLPYAPALAAAGIDLPHLALIRAAGRRDALWAAEQALRAGSCHALLAWLHSPGYLHLRRLAVAAEASRAFLVVFRPPHAAAESSPACLRIALEPAEGALQARILKRRGAPAAAPLLLPVKRPFHALGRAALSRPSDRNDRAARRLGLPVHA